MSLPSPAPRALEPEPGDYDEFVLSPKAAYNGTLHDLSLEDAMREAGQTIMRTDVTPVEHALLLAAREMETARQARVDAERAHNSAQRAYDDAVNAQWAAKRVYEAALAELTGEADCS